jgi:hypothetical protein
MQWVGEIGDFGFAKRRREIDGSSPGGNRVEVGEQRLRVAALRPAVCALLAELDSHCAKGMLSRRRHSVACDQDTSEGHNDGQEE